NSSSEPSPTAEGLFVRHAGRATRPALHAGPIEFIAMMNTANAMSIPATMTATASQASPFTVRYPGRGGSVGGRRYVMRHLLLAQAGLRPGCHVTPPRFVQEAPQTAPFSNCATTLSEPGGQELRSENSPA